MTRHLSRRFTRRNRVWIALVILFAVFTLTHQTAFAATIILGITAYGCVRWRMQHVLRRHERQEWIAQQRWLNNYPRGETYSREIPQEVKIVVTLRDGGRCRNCGSSDNLEYDHVIPYSRGGTNSVNNVQLLCQPCNRSKGARYQQAQYN
jgi:5-methylcytosine-specific restriction endonuclease McrA